MNRKFYLLLIACFSLTMAWSQTRHVTGRVTSDSTKQGIAGVNVSVKGSNVSTATTTDGRFAIEVPQQGNTSLVFTSVGYNTQEVTVGSKTNVDVTLSTSNSSLDVVIIGYQAVRRRDLTASVSSLNSKQLRDVPVNSAAEALSGKLAGVQVSVSEGAPGADVDVYVRGRNSITQSG